MLHLARGPSSCSAGVGSPRGSASVALRPKERSVLAALALSGHEAASTEAIATCVWGDHVPATAAKAVHNHIARIRHVAPGVIVTRGGGYHLDESVVVDLERPDAANAIPFADLADTALVVGDRYRIQERLAAEQEHQLGESLAVGVTPDLLEQLHRAADTEPLRERRWHQLALAQARLGQRREALLTLQRARTELAYVGLEPGIELLELERSILDGTSPVQAVAVRHIIHLHRGDPFVGRSGELQLLSRLLDTTITERRVHAVVIHGPAGMGKTRLIDRFVESLPQRDPSHRVLWGRHREVASRPHEMLGDTLTRLLDEEPTLVEAMTEEIGTLRAIVPTKIPAGASLPTMNESMMRAHITHAASSVIARVATSPTVWFIDDAQWATDESIEVIERTVQSTRGPLLIIVCTRPTVDARHRVIATLDRSVPTMTIDLAPFTVAELAELLGESNRSDETTGPLDAASSVAASSRAREVHVRTGGLPLYASELVRHARLTGAPVSSASSLGTIRDWVQHHVAGLRPDARSALEIASVIGDNIDSDLLIATSGEPAAEAAATIDELVALGLLTPTASAHLQFSHELTRDIVYDHIGAASRPRLHLIVARAIEAAAHGADPDPARLAHHYSLAGSAATRQAVDYSDRAGRLDLSVGAWSSAAAHFGRAAEHAPTAPARMQALIGAGRALLGGGHFDAAAARLSEAVVMARIEGDAVAQAEATIALVGRAGRGAAIDASDETQIAMVRSALNNIERVDRRGDRLAAILRSALERELAYALLLSDAEAERADLLFSAVERIEQLDPVPSEALAAALLGTRYAKLDGSDLEERLRDIDRVLGLPFTEVGPETLLAAYCYQSEELLRIGDRTGACDALDSAAAISRNYPDPYWIWSIATWRAIDALISGDLELAERRAIEAHAQRPNVAGAAACLGVNLINIRLYQGRCHEMVDMLAAAIQQQPEIPAYRAVMALCASESGEQDRASGLLRWFADERFSNLRCDSNRLLGLGVLAHVAADVHDVDAARQLLDLLEPFAGQWVTLACYGGGGASWGPIDHAVGRLLTVLDDHPCRRDSGSNVPALKPPKPHWSCTASKPTSPSSAKTRRSMRPVARSRPRPLGRRRTHRPPVAP